MNKMKVEESSYPITVNLEQLQRMLSLGRGSANDLAEKADAVIRIGKRKIYRVSKIEQYLDKQASGSGV